MVSEKESLLPIVNEKIESAKRDWVLEVDLGPHFKDGKCWWFLVNTWRMFLLVISSLPVFLYVLHSQYLRTIESRVLLFIIVFMVDQIVSPPVLLLLSYIFGQYDYFYLKLCTHFIWKYILSRDYILNRISSSSSSSI